MDSEWESSRDQSLYTETHPYIVLQNHLRGEISRWVLVMGCIVLSRCETQGGRRNSKHSRHRSRLPRSVDTQRSPKVVQNHRTKGLIEVSELVVEGVMAHSAVFACVIFSVLLESNGLGFISPFHRMTSRS